MPGNKISFFTTCLIKRGKITFADLHLKRLQQSLELHGGSKNQWQRLQLLWQGISFEAQELSPQKFYRLKVEIEIYNGDAKNLKLLAEISDFIPDPFKLHNVKTFQVNSRRWEHPPGFLKTDLSYKNFESFYQMALSQGFDEILISNFEDNIWPDSFYSNFLPLLDGTLVIPPSSHYVQSSVAAKSLHLGLSYSPWPVIYRDLKWQEVQNAEVLFLINALKGPRIVGKINAQELPTKPNVLTMAEEFYHRWYE